MAFEENTEFIWDLLTKKNFEIHNVDINDYETCKNEFLKIIKKIYKKSNTYDNVLLMNKDIIRISLETFNNILKPIDKKEKQSIILNCSLNDDKLVIYNNFGIVNNLTFKLLELHDCCVYNELNELNISHKKYLHEYSSLFIDVIINNKKKVKNILFFQKSYVGEKIVFISNEKIEYEDIITKIEFVIKDVILNYDTYIKTMINGYMLKLGENISPKLREPVYFTFLLNNDKNENSINTGDKLLLNDKTIDVLGTGWIDIINVDNIKLKHISNIDYNCFFCKLDNKYKLSDTPEKIVFKNKSKFPRVCIEVEN